uniref:Adhesion G protein-coupled receptor E8 n=1 Tax=Mastacembelus armatus TaxID=205130 RepID=A0A3Q3N645_9TELE
FILSYFLFLSHILLFLSPCLDHSDCQPDSCDINECQRTSDICGPYSNCSNTFGSYLCACLDGFKVPNAVLSPSPKNPCQDIDECLDNICGAGGTCYNSIGSFTCACHTGFLLVSSLTLAVSIADIDECFNSTVCGPDSICINTPGTYVCVCKVGYTPTRPYAQPSQTNICIDIDECVKNATICGDRSNCTNSIGSYICTCHTGYRVANPAVIASADNPCIGECSCLVYVRHALYAYIYIYIYISAVTGAGQAKNNMHWSVEGCWIAYSDENYTVCSCSHLSTFALIMQIGEDNFLEWLNRICVIVGLFFFALAILTFLLCSWNPKINNTARLHLCINLALSQLLLLWNDKYLACKVMAGLLHFLVVASFVWMLLEVQVIRRDGLPKLVLYLVGYGVPFVIVGISALVYSDGYGATESQACWLSRRRNFNWALTGPVIFVILNLIIFCATLWSLKPTLANMKSDVSQLIVFKILAQFVILGCTWILGLYQSNLFFQVLFIFLNSQQGTFLYIVHCLLNKEVREEYIKWLTCSIKKDTSEVSPWKYNILSQSILLQVLSLFHVIQF